MLSKKYKLFTLIIVSVAIAAVLVASNLEMFLGEDEGSAETVAEEFAPTDDPYTAFVEALEDQKPVVVEFYARW